MNISAVAGPSPYVHPPVQAARAVRAAAVAAPAQPAAPVDADGDHDGDTAANDRLDLRG